MSASSAAILSIRLLEPPSISGMWGCCTRPRIGCWHSAIVKYSPLEAGRVFGPHRLQDLDRLGQPFDPLFRAAGTRSRGRSYSELLPAGAESEDQAARR